MPKKVSEIKTEDSLAEDRTGTESEVEVLKRRMEMLELATQEALDVKEASCLALDGAQQELDRAEDELAKKDKEVEEMQAKFHAMESATKKALDSSAASSAALEEARRRLANQERATENADRELRKMQGDRESLRLLSSADLTALSENLMDSLARVQREHQRRFEQYVDEQLCVACLSERKNVVLQPCNHLTMCETCFNQCNDYCPQCRSEVRGHLVIYL